MQSLPGGAHARKDSSTQPDVASPHLLRMLEDALRAYERVWWDLRNDERVTVAQLRSLVTELHRLGRLQRGIVWCTDGHFRDTAGMSKRQVQRVLRLLERAGMLKRHGGSVAYWTHRAYGGTARMLGRYRIIELTAWRPKLAETFYEARALATSMRRVFRRDFGPVMPAHHVAREASVVPLEREAAFCEGNPGLAPSPAAPRAIPKAPEMTEADYHDRWLRQRERMEAYMREHPEPDTPEK